MLTIASKSIKETFRKIQKIIKKDGQNIFLLLFAFLLFYLLYIIILYYYYICLQ